MFRPLYERHAIREAAFAIVSRSPIEPAFVSSIGGNLLVPWRDVAPRRTDFRSMLVGSVPPGMMAPIPELLPLGLEYLGFAPDGGRTWRVAIELQSIVVNCLQYPGWPTAWPMIRGWFDWIVAQASGFEVAGFVLQYVNAFPWEGDPVDCRPSALLRPDSQRVAPTLYDYGDGRWHQHSGRFEPGGVPFGGETLVRTQLSGNRLGEGPESRYEAVVDVYLQTVLAPPVDIRGRLGTDDVVSQLYERLHSLVKQELSEYLRPELVEQIRLYG